MTPFFWVRCGITSGGGIVVCAGGIHIAIGIIGIEIIAIGDITAVEIISVRICIGISIGISVLVVLCVRLPETSAETFLP